MSSQPDLSNIDFTRDGSADLSMLMRYDSALLGILQHERKLENFMDVFFGFLSRKTDFFRTMKEGWGFPPGVPEQMLMSYYKKYKALALEQEQKTDNMEKKKKENKVKTTSKADVVTNQESNVAKTAEEPELKNAQKEQTETKASQPSSQEDFQANPDSYNGAVREKYMWSQNYEDVDIKVPVDKTILKGKQVQVTIQKQHIKVVILNDNGPELVVADKLEHAVKVNESMWSLMPGKTIEITLTKDTNYWWKKLLASEEEIDIKKIAPERNMADMAEDEIAVINKLQFDEKQKRLGLPQSHETKAHEMLKKGWEAEGSPFKGQQFDPKMFNISPNGIE